MTPDFVNVRPSSSAIPVKIGDREFVPGAVYRHRRLPHAWMRFMSLTDHEGDGQCVYWTSTVTGVTYPCTVEEWLDIVGEVLP